jgi:hypothetical protein
MERLFIDFMGPLTRSKRGNIAILVVVDAFSKFVSFFPVRRITSQVVCDCLERVFFPAYGTPASVVTDNAKVFRSKQMKDLCFRWGISHITATPYYPQSSLAERVNRNLKSALKIFHHESQVTWDGVLPCLSLAFNTAVDESTQCTPDKLFLGRELKSPLEVRWDLTQVDEQSAGESTTLFWAQAYANLRRARNKVAKRYDRGRKPHEYRVGDIVMYKMRLASSKANKVTAKLLLRWSKPVVIAKIVRPSVMLLASPETGVIIRRDHVKKLKPYLS